MTEELRLAPSFIASTFIHLVALVLASTLMTHQRNYRDQKMVAVRLLEVPSEEKAVQQRKRETPIVTRRAEPSVDQRDAKKLPIAKRETVTADRPVPPPMASVTKDETDKPTETKAPLSPTAERFPAVTTAEHGGAAGARNILGSEIGIVPGSGVSDGGSGTAIASLGPGSGTPGLSAQTSNLRTNREAKPIQTVRTAYPPMALRMGLEGDVTLRIEVDPEGKVTKAEIIKNAGAGFDEEALRAVRQSRFEPAQRNGQNVPGEFTYIYRFRLQR